MAGENKESTKIENKAKKGEKNGDAIKYQNNKMSEIDEHIARKFTITKRLGKGAYGIVWKAVDKKTDQVVAIKKIFDAFRNQTDAQRTFREIIFLQSFRNHPNIVKLHGVYRAANNRDIYLGFEYMDTDLHNVIKRGNILKDVHQRYVMYQLLKATKYIHSGNVIHRDQKPSNVLINNECRVKIADFGLARSVSSMGCGAGEGGANPCLTDYVATRWYRAPEILIASRNYTKGIDMWSLGCILAEMIVGKPLFPGSSTVNQVERIMSCIPQPSEEDINAVCTNYGSSLVRQNVTKRVPLQDLLQGGPADARDLTSRLLVFNPARRSTAEQALAHPYVARFHQECKEPVLKGDVVLPLSDNLRLSVDEYRNRLYGLIKRSSRSSLAGSDSSLSTLEQKCNSSSEFVHPPSKPARPPNPVGHQKPFRVLEMTKPPLSGILAKYAEGKIQATHLEYKMPTNGSDVSKNCVKSHSQSYLPRKLDKCVIIRKQEEKALNRSLKEKRAPLRKAFSVDEYSRKDEEKSALEKTRKTTKADFCRSISDDTHSSSKGRDLSKHRGSSNASFGGVASMSADAFQRSSLNKFSQKYGVVSVSALMDIRSNIR